MDFVTMLSNFGVAVACLTALGIVVWRAGVWFGSEILKPVAARHVRFLDELSTAMASQAQALQTMAVYQSKNLEGISKIITGLEEIMNRQKELEKSIARKEYHQ